MDTYLLIGGVHEKKKLIIGHFYLIYGGPPHPSKIYMYDSKHKTYLSLKFGTTKVRHVTRIHPIQKNQNEQYVHNRPFEGVKSDYGEKELIGLETNLEDELVFNEIKKRKPVKTSKAKRRYK